MWYLPNVFPGQSLNNTVSKIKIISCKSIHILAYIYYFYLLLFTMGRDEANNNVSKSMQKYSQCMDWMHFFAEARTEMSHCCQLLTHFSQHILWKQYNWNKKSKNCKKKKSLLNNPWNCQLSCLPCIVCKIHRYSKNGRPRTMMHYGKVAD